MVRMHTEFYNCLSHRQRAGEIAPEGRNYDIHHVVKGNIDESLLEQNLPLLNKIKRKIKRHPVDIYGQVRLIPRDGSKRSV
jgi:hypothetical protein